ncbi:type II secretion system protein [Pseudomonas aeruginosa]|nr:type II secretion system protein [Pseudomonas aeruginosa]
MNRKRQAGFTLIELMVVIAIFGVILYISGPLINSAFTFYEAAKRNEVVYDNQEIAGALLSFARNSNGGRLPAPYTGGSVNSGIYNPADVTATGTALTSELRNSGVPVSQINTDSTATKNVKVYRRVAGLTYNVPMYFVTGSQVSLTYDVGALVQTECGQSAACNTGTPGDSAALTAANIGTWVESGADYGAVVFSTLPAQKDMLASTTGRLNRLADRLSSEFYTRQRLAAANSTTNFFPLPTNAGALNYAGRNPVTNMGCHNGWYPLNSSLVNILAQIGLDQAEYGVTAWGGSIEYCQDYDPTAVGTGTANVPPHYAALRVNKNLSAAAAPTGVAGSDVVITF